MSDFKWYLTPSPEEAQTGIRWCLDAPCHLQTVDPARLLQDGLVLQGWLLHQAAEPARLYIRHDAKLIPIELTRPRPDVIRKVLQQDASKHPQLCCGFRVVLPLSDSQFQLVVETEQGQRAVLTAEVKAATQVLFGKDGWLFLDNDTNGSVDQFTGKRLLGWSERRRWKRYLHDYAALAAATSIPFALLMAPSKEAVYPQFYPYPRAKRTIMDQIGKLAPKSFPLLYPASSLAASEKRAYRLTDTHWSTHGARLASTELAIALGLERADVTAVFAKDHYYHSMVVGDLGNKVFPPRAAKEAFLDNYHYKKQCCYDNGLQNFGRVQVFANPKALVAGHCLVFGSSSSYAMLGYLTRLFQQLTLVHSAGNIDTSLVQALLPDYLVAQTNERFAIRAPRVGYSLQQSIQEKLAALTPTMRQQQQLALDQQVHAMDNVPIDRVHQYYQAAMQLVNRTRNKG